MKRLLISGLLLALGLAGGVSYYASSSPDGLNKVAADTGFAATAEDHPLEDSPVAGYEVRGVSDGRLSGGLAGVLGVIVTFAIGGVLFLAVRGRSDAGAGSGAGTGNGTATASGAGVTGPGGDTAVDAGAGGGAGTGPSPR